MDRRAALRRLGVLVPATAFGWPASGAERVFRIAYVANTVPMADLLAKRYPHSFKLIEDGLRAYGWVDGKNIELIFRSAEGDLDRLPAIAREVVSLKPDLIVAFGPGVRAAAQATSTIPIVMSTQGRPVETGLVKSLARPGGNITGMTLEVGTQLDGKRMALLKDAMPSLQRIAFMAEVPESAERPTRGPTTRAAAESLGISPSVARYRRTASVEEAFVDAKRLRAQAVIFPDRPDLNLPHHQKTIHALAITYRIPVMHTVLSAAETGGLMAFGSDINENYRRTPYFIDRILRGTSPAEIPIEQPSKFMLIVNIGAAKAIGLNLPPVFLAQADRVIGQGRDDSRG